jgi:elongation of very long chain fatty acids protein 4
VKVSFLHVYHHVSIAWAWWFAMLCWPGGDAYFGALLNSWIHVMMYSYYALSLLRVSCPWKRFLTQAQLLQFTTVIIYSCSTCYIHYKQNDAEFIHFLCVGVQCFEMTSLFLLFMHFYSKTYKKKASQKKTRSETENGSDSVPEQVSIASDSSDDAKKYS